MDRWEARLLQESRGLIIDAGAESWGKWAAAIEWMAGSTRRGKRARGLGRVSRVGASLDR